MKLSKEQSYRIIRSVLVAEHFLSDFIPHQDFLSTKIEALHLDDPPSSGDPDFEKRYLVIKIKAAYRAKGISLILSDKILKQKNLTLGELIDICSDPQRQEEI